MAQLSRSRGHRVIAITSLAHTRSPEARDTDGPHLADLADVVIDNRAPAGDASVDVTAEIRIGAVSSFTGVLIAQVLTELICRRLHETRRDLPVFVSANLAHGDAHNATLHERYGGRVRPIEP
jgi:uncharacterized phosphosugar-binding protein